MDIYTQMLREARLSALKQQYLEAIEQARVTRERKQHENDKLSRDAYIDKMNDYRDRPQQLRSLGLSGGVEQLDLEGIALEYQNRYEELKEQQRQFIDDYNRAVQKQQRLMETAVNEFNARIALEDYNAAQAETNKVSRSSGRRAKGSRGAVRTKSKNYGPPQTVEEIVQPKRMIRQRTVWKAVNDSMSARQP
ncbi:MAG: hypothetical protein RR998_06325 [Oscillospiraceae bacterium]